MERFLLMVPVPGLSSARPASTLRDGLRAAVWLLIVEDAVAEVMEAVIKVISSLDAATFSAAGQRREDRLHKKVYAG